MREIFAGKLSITQILKSNVPVLTLSLSLALAACSTSTPKPLPQPSPLRTITLNTNIVVVESPEFEPSGGAITTALNAMGAKVGNSRLEELKELIKLGGIDVGSLVLDSVRNEFGKSDIPIKIVERDGEADLQLNVEAYGLHKGLEWAVVPSIDLRASLVRTDGTTIWDSHEYIDQRHEFRSGIKTNTFSAYRENPELLKADYTKNIAWVVHELIEGLKDDHASGDIGN